MKKIYLGLILFSFFGQLRIVYSQGTHPNLILTNSDVEIIKTEMKSAPLFYKSILDAKKKMDVDVLGVFTAGCSAIAFKEHEAHVVLMDDEVQSWRALDFHEVAHPHDLWHAIINRQRFSLSGVSVIGWEH